MRKQTSVNYRNEAELIAGCPLAAAMTLIGGRWKLLLLWYVGHGIDRYGALRKTIPNISGKMLYQQLRDLERDGLMVRVISGRQVTYALTELGRSLLDPLSRLEVWSRDNDLGKRVLQARSEQTSAIVPATTLRRYSRP